MNVNKPILHVDRNMAYILGVIRGDGSVFKTRISEHSTGYYIKLGAKDKEFVDSFAKALEAINLNPSVFYREREDMWTSSVVSIRFYEWYTSMTWDELTSIIRRYPLEFVRGFYESDGSLCRFNNRHNSWSLYVAAKKDRRLLELVSATLREQYGFDTSMYVSRKVGYDDGYRLYLKGGKHERKRFLDMVKPCIRNKEHIH